MENSLVRSPLFGRIAASAAQPCLLCRLLSPSFALKRYYSSLHIANTGINKESFPASAPCSKSYPNSQFPLSRGQLNLRFPSITISRTLLHKQPFQPRTMAATSSSLNAISTSSIQPDTRTKSWATKQDWIRHQTLIRGHYEKHTLAKVMQVMKSQHGFQATCVFLTSCFLTFSDVFQDENVQDAPKGMGFGQEEKRGRYGGSGLFE